jgi:selenocysteine lyase/cysteine desulfurase
MPLACQRHLFDLPREVAYLNAAYMTPSLRAVTAAGTAAVARKARPWTIAPADFFTGSERARGLFAGLIGAGADDIAIVPAASYGLAVAAANLPLGKGQRVVGLRDQFPSNVYCWQRLAREQEAELVLVEAGEDGDLTAAVLAALDERTAIAALPHCRWTDGRLVDLVRVGERCRAVGAALVVDVTQSLGAWPLDVREVRPDFLVAAGYKWLLGPYSLGYLYVDPRWQDGRPLEDNWITRAGAEDFTRLVDYRDELAAGARRFDVGERSNFALMPMSLAALEQIGAWGIEAIAATLSGLTRTIALRTAALGLEAVPEHLRAGHYLGLRLPPGAPDDLTRRLAARQVHVSARGDRLRVTPHLYNDAADIDRLVEALAASL